ncbi:MBL fold metallo-hydrolase [Halorientalis sp. IM1011]|uniref:MBL fold metallo-hydrolase n=1 Tax=Halorientalis sp. IM1011 TaxID=1932360 RepID=UPI00097CCE68|nr:MBL fold metallo-hydrolase [Halorientalis sp. IM1011]AQL41414.1 MBL fold metallo-hydrolase [Halorientalis sp. IM1011]
MAAIQLLRHATLRVELDGTTFLVDPMLSEPGEIPPIPNSPNDRENPLVGLPDADLTADAVLVTHRHRDHFDDAAAEQLPDDTPILCQPAEGEAFRNEGFTDVRPVDEEIPFEGIDITRTPARHGHGDLAEQMGPSSGYVLEGSQTIYLAGDTVWYDAVPETIDAHDPDVVVVNAGAAQFVEGKPITMTPEEVGEVRDHVPDDVPVIADHMDAINHCLATRADLRAAVDGVTIPADGERVDL